MNMYYSVNRGWINISFNNTARGTYSPPTPSFPSIPPFHLPPAPALRQNAMMMAWFRSSLPAIFSAPSPPRPSRGRFATRCAYYSRRVKPRLGLLRFISRAANETTAIFDVYLVRESRAIFPCCDGRDNTHARFFLCRMGGIEYFLKYYLYIFLWK